VELVECVVNLSEGRDRTLLDRLAAAAGGDGGPLLDVHADVDHHRSVWTFAGPTEDVSEAVRGLSRCAVEQLDLRSHDGVHPRFGVIDVVPWVDLGAAAQPVTAVSLRARSNFAEWAAATLGLPCFEYGPERTLPDVRRQAFRSLVPDTGPARPHPTAGACAVGARGVLVAYNLWLAHPDLDTARRIAAEIRQPGLRTLGLAVGDGVQVSVNLTDPWTIGPARAFDLVNARSPVDRAELVGLVPAEILTAIPSSRWGALGLSPEQTIEHRLSNRPGGVPGPPRADRPGR